MNIVLSSIMIAVIFGTYDLFIKLGAGRIDPALGAMLTQSASAITLVAVFLFQKNSRPLATIGGVVSVIIAGILIASALIFLFSVLQDKMAKATTTLPTILILRNITLVILGIMILREKVSIIKTIGIAVSLLGVYMVSL